LRAVNDGAETTNRKEICLRPALSAGRVHFFPGVSAQSSANSGSAVIFWFFCIKAKERTKQLKKSEVGRQELATPKNDTDRDADIDPDAADN
jgi:hypothetical protein